MDHSGVYTGRVVCGGLTSKNIPVGLRRAALPSVAGTGTQRQRIQVCCPAHQRKTQIPSIDQSRKTRCMPWKHSRSPGASMSSAELTQR